jgi:hypothetical protein
MAILVKERAASSWLIAERARCRLEGLRLAKKLFEEYPFLDAMQKVVASEQLYEAIIQDPKPTGVPGQ